MKQFKAFKEVMIALAIVFATCITFATLDDSSAVRLILYGDYECQHFHKSEVTGNVRYSFEMSSDTYYDENGIRYHEGPRGNIFQAFYVIITIVIVGFIIDYFIKKYNT
jgi:hypothetical protein